MIELCEKKKVERQVSYDVNLVPDMVYSIMYRVCGGKVFNFAVIVLN